LKGFWKTEDKMKIYDNITQVVGNTPLTQP
jgi:hypothetical protein